MEIIMFNSGIEQPKDKGIFLKDILENDNQNEATCGAYRGRYIIDGKRQDGKMSTKGITTQKLELRKDKKTNTLTTVQKDNVIVVDNLHIRKLTVREYGRLQTVPEEIINKMLDSGVSNSQLYKMIGNGWTVDVVSWIFRGLH